MLTEHKKANFCIMITAILIFILVFSVLSLKTVKADNSNPTFSLNWQYILDSHERTPEDLDSKMLSAQLYLPAAAQITSGPGGPSIYGQISSGYSTNTITDHDLNRGRSFLLGGGIGLENSYFFEATINYRRILMEKEDGQAKQMDLYSFGPKIGFRMHGDLFFLESGTGYLMSQKGESQYLNFSLGINF